jgi:hypothetical protein
MAVKKTTKASKGKAVLKATGRALKGAARGILASGAQILGASATALNPIREKLLPTGTRVRFKDGYEHGGKTGVITSVIPVYVKEKHWTYRIQLDGISGGKGQVLAEERLFSVINPKRKNKTIIKAKRVVVVRNKTAKKATKRKRNLDHRDSTHQVQVSKHWRAGGLSQWQRAHHAGQKDLFGHGIKAKAKRNPLIQPGRRYKMKPDYEPTAMIEAGMRGGFKAVFIAKDGLAGQVGGFKTRAEATAWAKAQGFKVEQKTKKRNATRAIRPRKAAKSSRRVLSSGRKPRATGSKKRVAVARKRKTNPSAGEIRKEFAGRHTKDSRLYFPDGTPQGLAKLGKLVLIKTKSGPIQLVNRKGEVWLCVDTNKRFHLGSTINAPLFDGAKNFGEVKEIEYQESKPHLGYTKKIIWFHHMGEEGGRRPELISNSKGELKFKGGDYRITTRGIEN